MSSDEAAGLAAKDAADAAKCAAGHASHAAQAHERAAQQVEKAVVELKDAVLRHIGQNAPSSASPSGDRAPTTEILLGEYAAAQADYIHQDSYPWQVGAILAASAFVLCGLITTITDPETQVYLGVVCSAFIAALMSIWFLYVEHCRQIYLWKLERMWEIEHLLGMDLQSRWRTKQAGGRDAICVTYGPSGHGLNVWIFSLTNLLLPVVQFCSARDKYILGKGIGAFVAVAITALVWLYARSCQTRASDEKSKAWESFLRNHPSRLP